MVRRNGRTEFNSPEQTHSHSLDCMASYTGPAQFPSPAVLQATESWAEPENEASLDRSRRSAQSCERHVIHWSAAVGRQLKWVRDDHIQRKKAQHKCLIKCFFCDLICFNLLTSSFKLIFYRSAHLYLGKYCFNLLFYSPTERSDTNYH